jgi:hypothetical protein
MVVLAEHLRAFERDGAVAERGSFGAAGDDADVERHVFGLRAYGFRLRALLIGDWYFEKKFYNNAVWGRFGLARAGTAEAGSPPMIRF